jgi:hypothetical protein
MSVTFSEAKSVETRQREALAYTLSQVREFNGYHNTFGTVFFSLSQRYEAAVWPVVTLLNLGGPADFGSTNTLDKTAVYDVLIYKQPSSTASQDDANLWRENIRVDVEMALSQSGGALIGEDERPTARIAWVSSARPLYKLLEQDYIGIHMKITVEYQTDYADATLFV